LLVDGGGGGGNCHETDFVTNKKLTSPKAVTPPKKGVLNGGSVRISRVFGGGLWYK